jgi:hypothetical protein
MAAAEGSWVFEQRKRRGWPWRWLRVLCRVAVWLQAPIVAPGELFTFATQRTRTLRGIRVGVFGWPELDKQWRVIDTGLEIVEAWHPRAFESLKHDVRRIATIHGHSSRFSQLTKVCYLSDRTVLRFGPVQVASELVHEALHARLRRRGLAAWDLDFRARVEQLCIDEEIWFLRLLPPAAFVGIDELLHYNEERRQLHAAKHRIALRTERRQHATA